MTDDAPDAALRACQYEIANLKSNLDEWIDSFGGQNMPSYHKAGVELLKDDLQAWRLRAEAAEAALTICQQKRDELERKNTFNKARGDKWVTLFERDSCALLDLKEQFAELELAAARTAQALAKALAQLRHAYQLCVNDAVPHSHGGIVTFAEGLIAPQIRRLEELAAAGRAVRALDGTRKET